MIEHPVARRPIFIAGPAQHRLPIFQQRYHPHTAADIAHHRRPEPPRIRPPRQLMRQHRRQDLARCRNAVRKISQSHHKCQRPDHHHRPSNRVRPRHQPRRRRDNPSCHHAAPEDRARRLLHRRQPQPRNRVHHVRPASHGSVPPAPQMPAPPACSKATPSPTAAAYSKSAAAPSAPGPPGTACFP